MPFELGGVPYVDFCGRERDMPFDELYAAMTKVRASRH
jgi:hypothetical protein